MPFAKAEDIKSHWYVCLSQKLISSINDRALIFGMHDPCDKSFLLLPCGDLDLDLLPTSMSNYCRAGDHNSLHLLVNFMGT